MVAEDLIKQIAAQVAAKVGSSKSGRSLAEGRKCLLVFANAEVGVAAALKQIRAAYGSSGGGLRAVFMPEAAALINKDFVARELPGIEFLPTAVGDYYQRVLESAEQIIIPNLSLSLAAKLAALNADTPVANLCLQALFNRCRVIAVTDSLVGQSALPPGLAVALKELKSKLNGLGLELTTANELGSVLAAAARQPHSLPIIEGQPTPFHSHPSQEHFDSPEELTEFVDYLETKTCVLEPGKPCCNRGECRSRGF